MESVNFGQQTYCHRCSGMGHVAASDMPLDMERVECPECRGTGGGYDPWLLTHDERTGQPLPSATRDATL